MPKFPPLGVTAVVDGYKDYLQKMGGMSQATSATHTSIAKLAATSLGGVVTGAAAAAAAIGVIGVAAAAAGVVVGKVLYDIAEKSAYMIDIHEAFNTFTQRAGKFADEVIGVWQDASAGVISNIDLMATYNTSIRRLGDTLTEELPKAFPLLKKAAESSGEDFATFTQKLIGGIGRLRMAQLAQLGVNIDLTQLTEDYAKAHGIEAKAVSKETQRTLVFAEALKQLKEEFGDLVPVGEEADDVFERIRVDIKNAKDTIKMGIAEAMIPLAQAFEGLSKEYLPDFTRYMRAVFIPKLGELVKWIADKLIPALRKMGVWVGEKAKKAWASLKSWFDMNWPIIKAKAEALWTAVQANWAKFKVWLDTKFMPAWGRFKEWWTVTAWPAIKSTAEKAWTTVQAKWEIFRGWYETTFLPAWGKLKTWFDTNWPIIKDKAEKLWLTVQANWTTFKGWLETTFTPAWDTLKAWWDTNWPTIKKTLEDTWVSVQAKWTEFQTWYTGTFLPAFEQGTAEAPVKLSKSQQAVLDFWENTMKPALESVAVYFNTIVLPSWQAAWDLISAVLTTAWANLVWLWENTLKPALDTMHDSFGAVTDALGLGQSTWDDFKTTIENIGKAIEPVVQWVHDLADDIRNMTIPKLLQGNSPSPFEKTLKGIKEQLLELHSIGMPSMGGALLKALPAGGASAGGSSTSQAFNLTVNSSAPREQVVADFGMMQALSRRR
jgi:hypothetical protein